MPVASQPLDPDNIEIATENTGPLPLINLRIAVNGRYNWYTLEGLTVEGNVSCRNDGEEEIQTHRYFNIP